MPYWAVIPISNNSITPTGAQCDQDFCGVVPCSDPRPAGLVLVWLSYNPHHSGKKRRYCMNSPALQAPPKTSFGCRKGGAFLHGSTPCWCRQTCEPSEWVSEEYVCASMHDGGRRAQWCVRTFRTVSPETRASLSRREHGRFFLRMRVASPTYRACPSQDRRVYAASAPSHCMARVLLAVRTSSRMQEIK